MGLTQGRARSVAAATAAALVLVAGPFGVTASASCGWQGVPAPALAFGLIAQITGTSPTDVWAIGSYQLAPTPPLALHWDGIRWTQAPQERMLGYGAGAVAIAPDDVWAVGNYGPAFSMHWDGAIWRRVPVPTQGGTSGLASVDAVSSTDVWAAGDIQDAKGLHVLVMHWDGTAWTRVPAPDGVPHSTNILYGIDALSGDDIWAVGLQEPEGLDAQPLIEHWDGEAWSVIPSPSFPGNDNTLYKVSGTSSSDVWAVGFQDDTLDERPLVPLIEHWDGTEWSVVPSPHGSQTDAALSGVIAVSAADVWAVGERAPGGGETALIMHWDGRRWRLVRAAAPESSALVTVAAITPTDIWAGGAYYDYHLQFSRPLTMLRAGC